VHRGEERAKMLRERKGSMEHHNGLSNVNVAMMESRTKGISEGVGQIDNTGHVRQNDFAVSLPILDIKVTRAGRRTASIDHQDSSGIVVFIKRGRFVFMIAELGEDGAQILGNLGGIEIWLRWSWSTQ
jgi:hypothetical protein